MRRLRTSDACPGQLCNACRGCGYVSRSCGCVRCNVVNELIEVRGESGGVSARVSRAGVVAAKCSLNQTAYVIEAEGSALVIGDT